MKSLLTKGKVVIAGMMGDKAILEAMRTNEADTNTAYKRAVAHEGVPSTTLNTLRRGLQDERRQAALNRKGPAFPRKPAPFSNPPAAEGLGCRGRATHCASS